MSKILVTIILLLLNLSACKAQEQKIIEPCANEIIQFDSNRVNDWKQMLIEYMNESGYSYTDESGSLSKLMKREVFYVRFHDKKYLDIKKGGYGISINNVERAAELNITVYNSKNDDITHCQKSAKDVLELLSK